MPSVTIVRSVAKLTLDGIGLNEAAAAALIASQTRRAKLLSLSRKPMMALMPTSQAPVTVDHIEATPYEIILQTLAASDVNWLRTVWRTASPLFQSFVILAHNSAAPAAAASQTACGAVFNVSHRALISVTPCCQSAVTLLQSPCAPSNAPIAYRDDGIRDLARKAGDRSHAGSPERPDLCRDFRRIRDNAVERAGNDSQHLAKNCWNEATAACALREPESKIRSRRSAAAAPHRPRPTRQLCAPRSRSCARTRDTP